MQAFFESLKDVKNRRREAWVLEAARYLHHPLRAATSKKFVIDALGLVREIQQTGDIFFPKRWADATLSGYQSPQTAADVRQFIEELPADYPPRLRWVLLSSADAAIPGGEDPASVTSGFGPGSQAESTGSGRGRFGSRSSSPQARSPAPDLVEPRPVNLELRPRTRLPDATRTA